MRKPQISSISFLSLLMVLYGIGCATTAQQAQRDETVSAMEKVLTTVSGQNIDDKRLRELDREIQKDPEAKSAIQSIANAVSGQGQRIKYCPIDGQRYGSKFTHCPIHNVLLETISE